MCYELIQGEGPQSGWVSAKLRGKAGMVDRCGVYLGVLFDSTLFSGLDSLGICCCKIARAFESSAAWNRTGSAGQEGSSPRAAGGQILAVGLPQGRGRGGPFKVRMCEPKGQGDLGGQSSSDGT